jgi:PAS domain S-box-containing protein
MTKSKSAQQRDAAKVYAAIFANAPCPFLVLTPELQIVDGNPAYLAATGQSRDGLVGLDMFEAFPDNPADPLADGVYNLGCSFERAMRFGKRDLMPLQRYDVRDRRKRWVERYWRPANWPVREDGRLIAVVHHVVDLTEEVQAQARAPKARFLALADRADLAVEMSRRLCAKTEADLDRVRAAFERRLQARRRQPD